MADIFEGDDALLSKTAGSPAFMAPECLQGQCYLTGACSYSSLFLVEHHQIRDHMFLIRHNFLCMKIISTNV